MFEDFTVGQKERFGSYLVTREEVIDFASRFDPQPFHLDDAAAAANPIFGRLSASGVHTTAMMTRMMVDYWRPRGGAGMGGAGMDISFVKPVYPGDTLSCEIETLEAVPSRSRPDRGMILSKVTVLNQHGEVVLTMTGRNVQPRRDAG